jgi:hypothetical protein
MANTSIDKHFGSVSTISKIICQLVQKSANTRLLLEGPENPKMKARNQENMKLEFVSSDFIESK